MPDKLESLVKEMKFSKISPIHGVIPLPLIASIATFISSSAQIIESLAGKEFKAAPVIASLLSFYGIYVIASSVSAYILLDKLIDHINYSSITFYYWSRRYGISPKTVLLTSLSKRKIPSPFTGLVLTLVTAGLAYPLLLWVFEKHLRDHASSEEEALYGTKYTRSIDVGHLLLYIGLTLLTLGLYMIYWIMRTIAIYNRHIESMHSTHPEPPKYHGGIGEPLYMSSLVALAIAISLSVVHLLLALHKNSSYPIFTLGYGFMFAYIVWNTRYHSILKQSLILLGFEYILIIMASSIGMASYDLFGWVMESFRESFKKIVEVQSIPAMSINIFANNLRITLSGLIPVIGYSIIGYAMANTGFVLGLFMGSAGIWKGFNIMLSTLMMPHSPLELYSYALAAATSSKIGLYGVRKLFTWAVVSILILFIAAVVESLIIFFKM